SLSSYSLTLLPYFRFLFFYRSSPLRDLHSFPTRRSSDLHGRVRRLSLLHVLPRRARPPSRLQRRQRPDARVRRALGGAADPVRRSEEHTSELQSLRHLVCRLLLEKKKKTRRAI